MPKIFNSYSSKLNSYVNLFDKNILQTDGKILTCKVCCTRVNGERKSLVRQHIKGKEHKLRVSQASQRQPLLEFPIIFLSFYCIFNAYFVYF